MVIVVQKNSVQVIKIDKTVIFHHIPKTAGTTFNSILDNQKNINIYTIDGNQDGHENSIRQFIAISKSEKSKIQILKGHNVYGLNKYFDQPVTYITFVRKPAQRFISSYFQMLKVKPILKERIAFNSSPPTITEYIENGDLYYGKNSLIKSYLNIRNKEIEVDDVIFKEAIRALNEDYSFTGLTEHFDESIVLLNRKFGWKIGGYVSKNIAHNYNEESRNSNLIDLYAKNNPYDILFYEKVCELFNSKLAESGDSFTQDLLSFQRSNRKMNKYNQIQIKIRNVIKNMLGR